VRIERRGTVFVFDGCSMVISAQLDRAMRRSGSGIGTAPAISLGLADPNQLQASPFHAPSSPDGSEGVVGMSWHGAVEGGMCRQGERVEKPGIGGL